MWKQVSDEVKAQYKVKADRISAGLPAEDLKDEPAKPEKKTKEPTKPIKEEPVIEQLKTEKVEKTEEKV